MIRFIYAKSTFNVAGSKFFGSSCKSLARFTREGLRERLKKPNKVIIETHTLRPDSVPVRPMKDLWKCLGFTAVIGSSLFAAAAVLEFEKNKRHLGNMFSNFEYPALFNNQNEFQKLNDGQKWALGVIGLNTIVFLLWKVPAVEKFMWQFFTNSYASRSLCSPMLLSVFSHYSAIHLALNMYVLYNFVPVSINKFLGPEQFTAFYLTAGVVSSLTSLAHKAVVRSPVRALGASGAILGALCYVCMQIPTARLSIVFLPMFSFPAESAVYGLIVFDLAGLLLGFRTFDHAAHLGGALFGIFYAWYGEKFMNEVLNPAIISFYKRVTGSKPPSRFD